MNSSKDLGSNAALCLLKRRIGEFKSVGVNLQDTNANDGHKLDPGILLMTVS